MLPRVKLPDRIAGHVLKGTPWLFDDVLPSGPPLARTGDFVELATSTGRSLGYALYDAASPIALRVLTTRRDEFPGPQLWETRLRQAHTLRNVLLDPAETNAFRLLHGEGDRLPGVVVDVYAGTLVVKLDTPAWLPHLDDLTAVLRQEMKPRAIYFKGISGRRSAARREAAESQEAKPRMLAGRTDTGPLEVLEHGMKLVVDIVEGQKTGLFLDQRENRRLIRGVSRGLEVLNLFCYTGGFSVAAALGGARHVTSVDLAGGAVALARETMARNGFPPEAHTFVVGDALEALAGQARERKQFDLVVVDPPSYAPREDAVRKALHAYKHLNEKAIRRVRPGGFLATSSCSSHVAEEPFFQMLREAAVDAERTLRVIEVRREAPDHPVPLHFPQGHYLKFVLAVVD